MREDFLHHLWRWRKFDQSNLSTTDGQPLEIIHPGELNSDAGPDFFNARLRIGETQWAGNVEIHLRASDWLAHRHDSDPAYQNVVLHVVWENDQPIFLKNEEFPLACLELESRTSPQILENYTRLFAAPPPIPCGKFFKNVPEIIRLNWLDRLLAERLEMKTEPILAALAETENHWEEVFYRSLARSFGLKINALPFETLARSLPVQILGKHKNSLFQLESLIFGQAGLLAEPLDDYQKSLAKEHHFLQKKYGLAAAQAGSNWKFLRLRPANFPTVRLAQFALLVHRAEHLFSKTLELKTVRELENLFDAGVSDYWLTHYRFGKTSARRVKNLGSTFVELLLVNTVIPFIFLYGKLKNLPDLQDRALRLLESLPAESNSILDDWAAVGVAPRNGFEGQALLHLRKHFCDTRRCLHCSVGHFLLR